MSAEDLVRRALPIFLQNAQYELITLRVALTVKFFKEHETEALVEFVPLAFGRSLLDGMGIRFEDDYVRVDAGGNERMRRRLADEPVYVAALKLAPIVMQSMGQDAFMAIAGRSSELQAVNAALNAGSAPADLQASTPVLAWTSRGMARNRRRSRGGSSGVKRKRMC